MNLDLAAIEAAHSPFAKVRLLRRKIKQVSLLETWFTTEPLGGFGQLSRVHAKLSISVFEGRADPWARLIVESSADGHSDWSVVASKQFEAAGSDLQTIVAPQAFLRGRVAAQVDQLQADIVLALSSSAGSHAY